VVTPEDATSPMDAASTVQIPRLLIQAADPSQGDPELTMIVSRGPVGPDPDWSELNWSAWTQPPLPRQQQPEQRGGLPS
jgi:hypothetical protein